MLVVFDRRRWQRRGKIPPLSSAGIFSWDVRVDKTKKRYIWDLSFYVRRNFPPDTTLHFPRTKYVRARFHDRNTTLGVREFCGIAKEQKEYRGIGRVAATPTSQSQTHKSPSSLPPSSSTSKTAPNHANGRRRSSTNIILCWGPCSRLSLRYGIPLASLIIEGKSCPNNPSF